MPDSVYRWHCDGSKQQGRKRYYRCSPPSKRNDTKESQKTKRQRSDSASKLKEEEVIEVSDDNDNSSPRNKKQKTSGCPVRAVVSTEKQLTRRGERGSVILTNRAQADVVPGVGVVWRWFDLDDNTNKLIERTGPADLHHNHPPTNHKPKPSAELMQTLEERAAANPKQRPVDLVSE